MSDDDLEPRAVGNKIIYLKTRTVVIQGKSVREIAHDIVQILKERGEIVYCIPGKNVFNRVDDDVFVKGTLDHGMPICGTPCLSKIKGKIDVVQEMSHYYGPFDLDELGLCNCSCYYNRENEDFKKHVMSFTTKKELPVITLCGSVKFRKEIQEAEAKLISEGWCVLSIGYPGELNDRVKEILQQQHHQKILMSEAIYVINKDGYIGESTKEEISFAISNNVRVIYMETNGCDRTHEECAECKLEKVSPPQCKGHCAGPSHCYDFIREARK